MSAAWIFLLLAGLFEIGWPVGLKISQEPGRFWAGVAIAVICLALSGACMWQSYKELPMGLVYAVWTGIGAAGTFLVGVAFFGDALTLLRALSVLLILVGVVGLKLSSG